MQKKILLASEKFLDDLRKELQPIRKKILTHPFVGGVERGKTSIKSLQFFTRQQFHIVSGDFRNLALYIAFSPNQKIRDFFLHLIDGERSALDNLFRMAKALELSTNELVNSEPHAGSLAFTNYFTRLATYGSPGETASSIILDFEVWGENCHRISKGLKKHYGLTSEDTKFLDGFYPIGSEFYSSTLSIIGEYIRMEGNKRKMKTAARLALDYELMFWDTMHNYKEKI